MGRPFTPTTVVPADFPVLHRCSPDEKNPLLPWVVFTVTLESPRCERWCHVQRLEQAITGLEQSLLASPGWPQSWRLCVRQRLLAVADALSEDTASGDDSGLSAREDSLRRERKRLLVQLSLLVPEVAEARDLEAVRRKALRFARDVDHHNQRVHDLMYDAMSMEVGGSE